MTSSDFANYSLTRSTRGLSATAELLVFLKPNTQCSQIVFRSDVCCHNVFRFPVVSLSQYKSNHEFQPCSLVTVPSSLLGDLLFYCSKWFYPKIGLTHKEMLACHTPALGQNRLA